LWREVLTGFVNRGAELRVSESEGLMKGEDRPLRARVCVCLCVCVSLSGLHFTVKCCGTACSTYVCNICYTFATGWQVCATPLEFEAQGHERRKDQHGHIPDTLTRHKQLNNTHCLVLFTDIKRICPLSQHFALPIPQTCMFESTCIHSYLHTQTHAS